MTETILNVVIGGLLIGGVYALIAMGLSLQYGVARVLNIAHGEFIMLGAFITFWLQSNSINPLLSIVIVGPITFVLGFILYRTLFTSLRNKAPNTGAFEASSMLAAFGLLFIVQNVAILLWGTSVRGYQYLSTSVNVGGALFSANRMVTAGFAVAIGLAFYFFLARTRVGKAIRAAAQDAATAGLMGVNINFVLALCFGFGAAMAGVAGSLLSMCYSIQTNMGLSYTIIAIVVVVFGGLGSIPGSFIGGFIMGVIGSIVSYWQPGLAVAAFYLIFVLLLLVRPKGIMGK